MAICKCKMCGGDLHIEETDKVVECEYCGTTQTVPSADSEKKMTLFNRANILRMKSEFDKAESLYEKIIQSKPDEAEAYWGLILCRYGIEYVEDPKTFKRVPTCHRTSFDSVIADEDYKAALQYADAVQRELYQAEAKEIDRLQKEILALSQKEEPYDVFICYKETDDSGRRTPDSVVANDIYHQLTQEGFKVFYAAISLENKLGSAYEPCIFAALNSAKVMLVVGTKPEYFNAVWVKNEWSRYLKLMQKDRSRILIPCYKDMDAYELPEEFAHLQAQDMGKIGFINDVVRGIKKVLRKDAPAVQPAAAPASANAAAAQPLIDRGYMALEDKEWAKADDFFEQALNLDAKNGDAYLGKFLVSVKHSSFQSFLSERSDRAYIDRTHSKPQKAAFKPKEDALKQMAAQYAVPGYLEEETLLQELSGFDPNFASEYDQVERHISGCHMRMDTNKDLLRAKQYGGMEISRQVDALFETLNGMLAQAKQADENTVAEKRNAYQQFVRDFQIKAAQRSAEARKQADADAAEQARLAEEERAAKERDLNDKYSKAVLLANKANSVDTYNQAIKAFVQIKTYRDSDKQIQALTVQRDRIAAQKEKERSRTIKKAALISVPAIVAVAVLAVLTVTVFIPTAKYNAAKDLYKNGQFDEAIAAFEAMDGYKDSAEMIKECKNAITESDYNYAVELMNNGHYSEALSIFNEHSGFKDTKAKIDECKNAISESAYNAALQLMKNRQYDEAIEAFSSLNGFKDSRNKISQCEKAIADSIAEGNYKNAVKLMDEGSPFSAYQIFTKLDDYKDSKKQAEKCWNQNLTRKTVSVGDHHTVGLKKDGTVVATGSNDNGQCNVSGWKDIIAVSAGGYHTVGLKKDGTVVAVGKNDDGQCNVSGWRDIIAISAGILHTVGLKKDGTVVAVGSNIYGQCDVSSWKDIIAIDCSHHTVGLKKDGTVVAAGINLYGQCDVSSWKNITAISVDIDITVGLKKSGTVVTAGRYEYGKINVSDWEDIIAVSVGGYHTIGLKKDGTVVTDGISGFSSTNYVDVIAGRYNVVGLKDDGTVSIAGVKDNSSDDVTNWKRIKLP